MRHDAVCSALMDAGAVAPVRFGAAFSGVERLRDSIAGRRDALRPALARVDGCVELAVRVVRPDSPPEEATPTGRAYLERRLEKRRAGRLAASALDERLGAFARDRRVRTIDAPGALVVGLAYLVSRSDVEGFRAAVAESADASPELTLVCTGPWPPYSFVSEDG